MLRAYDYSTRVKVTVVGITDIPRLDPINTIDPFCLLQIEGHQESFKTTVKDENQNPVWNESFESAYHESDPEQLAVSLFDRDDVGASMKVADLAARLPREQAQKEGTHQMTLAAVQKGANIPVSPLLRLHSVTTIIREE
jgi:Ca2+-dependent lipid-binding protein